MTWVFCQNSNSIVFCKSSKNRLGRRRGGRKAITNGNLINTIGCYSNDACKGQTWQKQIN
jgi:hypothetical protein